MDTHSTRTKVQLTRGRAKFRLRQLLDELHLLIGSFPDLHDAFDADELPLAFILERDSRLTADHAGPRKTFTTRKNPVNPRTTLSRTHNRGGRRKQMSDE